MAQDGNIAKMAVFAAGLVVLAIVSVIGIVVLDEFKTSIITSNTQPNTTIDLFIAAIAVFGTFATVIALVLVAKIILSLVKGGFN